MASCRAVPLWKISFHRVYSYWEIAPWRTLLLRLAKFVVWQNLKSNCQHVILNTVRHEVYHNIAADIDELLMSCKPSCHCKNMLYVAFYVSYGTHDQNLTFCPWLPAVDKKLQTTVVLVFWSQARHHSYQQKPDFFRRLRCVGNKLAVYACCMHLCAVATAGLR